MKTTLSIDNDVLAAARRLAAAERRSLGAVISDLTRRGLRPVVPDRRERGFPVFEVPPDAPSVTLEKVRRALAD